jgi:glycosyltransferase involved in cell wall biosynthesis
MQLIVPAFNEEARLPGTLAALREFLLSAQESAGPVEVIVVDNASTDATAQLARSASTVAMPVQVISCGVRGKGAAVRAGIAHSTADVVGFMDADCATDLSALVEGKRLLSAGADVAIASRAVEGSVTTERHSRVRALGATLYRRCTRQIAPGIADTQCGFKLFRGDLAREVFASTKADGFSFDVEVLGRAQRHGARIVEFPAVWDDVPGSTFLPFWELAMIARQLRRTTEVVTVPHVVIEPAPLALLPAVEG